MSTNKSKWIYWDNISPADSTGYRTKNRCLHVSTRCNSVRQICSNSNLTGNKGALSERHINHTCSEECTIRGLDGFITCSVTLVQNPQPMYVSHGPVKHRDGDEITDRCAPKRRRGLRGVCTQLSQSNVAVCKSSTRFTPRLKMSSMLPSVILWVLQRFWMIANLSSDKSCAYPNHHLITMARNEIYEKNADIWQHVRIGQCPFIEVFHYAIASIYMMTRKSVDMYGDVVGVSNYLEKLESDMNMTIHDILYVNGSDKLRGLYLSENDTVKYFGRPKDYAARNIIMSKNILNKKWIGCHEHIKTLHMKGYCAK